MLVREQVCVSRGGGGGGNVGPKEDIILLKCLLCSGPQSLEGKNVRVW